MIRESENFLPGNETPDESRRLSEVGNGRTRLTMVRAVSESTSVELLREFERTKRPEPFAELMRRHGGVVFATCLKVTKDPHDAEDATQAAFLTLAAKSAMASEIREPEAWLRRVAHRLSLDLIRSRKRRHRREQVRSEMHTEVTPSTGLDHANNTEAKRVLHEELANMPASYRMPLILHYFGGLTRDEMSDQLKVKPSTLGVRLHRAREQLRKRMAKRGIDLPAIVVTSLLVETIRRSVLDGMVASAAGHAAIGGGATFAGGAAFHSVATQALASSPANVSAWSQSGFAFDPTLVIETLRLIGSSTFKGPARLFVLAATITGMFGVGVAQVEQLIPDRIKNLIPSLRIPSLLPSIFSPFIDRRADVLPALSATPLPELPQSNSYASLPQEWTMRHAVGLDTTPTKLRPAVVDSTTAKVAVQNRLDVGRVAADSFLLVPPSLEQPVAQRRNANLVAAAPTAEHPSVSTDQASRRNATSSMFSSNAAGGGGATGGASRSTARLPQLHSTSAFDERTRLANVVVRSGGSSPRASLPTPLTPALAGPKASATGNASVNMNVSDFVGSIGAIVGDQRGSVPDLVLIPASELSGTSSDFASGSSQSASRKPIPKAIDPLKIGRDGGLTANETAGSQAGRNRTVVRQGGVIFSAQITSPRTNDKPLSQLGTETTPGQLDSVKAILSPDKTTPAAEFRVIWSSQTQRPDPMIGRPANFANVSDGVASGTQAFERFNSAANPAAEFVGTVMPGSLAGGFGMPTRLNNESAWADTYTITPTPAHNEVVNYIGTAASPFGDASAAPTSVIDISGDLSVAKPRINFEKADLFLNEPAQFKYNAGSTFRGLEPRLLFDQPLGVNGAVVTLVGKTGDAPANIRFIDPTLLVSPALPAEHSFIGVWSLDAGGDFEWARIAVQYDEFRLHKLGLVEAFTKLWVSDGLTWSMMLNDPTFSRNTTINRLSVDVRSPFILFAASTPEPASIVTLLAAAGVSLSRRRR